MNMSKNKLFPLNSASDRLVTEIVISDCKYMKIIDMNCGCRNEYVSDLHPLFRSLLQRSLSLSGLNFFLALFSPLLKKCS